MQNDKLFLLFQFIPHRHTHTQAILEYGLCCSKYLAQNTATVFTMIKQHTTKQLSNQPTKKSGRMEGKNKRKKEGRKEGRKERKERNRERKKEREEEGERKKERRKERKT